MTDIDPETKEILEKYKQKLSEEINFEDDKSRKNKQSTPESRQTVSKQYRQFREGMMPKHFSWYEKACNFSESIVKISPDKKSLEEMNEAINTAHLNVTSVGVSSFAILGPLSFMLVGVFLSLGIPYALGLEPSMFFLVFSVIGGVIAMMPLQNFPKILANTWRLKASNEMVLAVFYTVTYMRHTSNLENALEFSASHLSGPLSLDLRKVIWDLETEKYSSVKESLDAYLETWRKWNMEFIEAMHLIESSLYEGSEDRRLSLLDKSIDIMLQETYEKMLHYAHNLKAPMTSLNMLGFVLPILGLVLLPLIVNFMGTVKWYYLFMIYDIALPLGVFYLGKNILSSRPTGYGDTDITQNNPQLKKHMHLKLNLFGKEKTINPFYISIMIFIVFFLIGISPVLFTSIGGMQNIKIGENRQNTLFPEECKQAEYCLFEFRSQTMEDDSEVVAGPFDLISSVLSILVPLSIGLSWGLYHKIRTKEVIKIRDKSKELEKEFSAALFQLGNRLGDGIPAEIAFGKVGNVMGSSASGNFFNQVGINISQRGMGIDDALFNKNNGVIFQYPSSIILSSMKVLVEAVKKSPKIAAQAIISISSYIKEMHRIDERLKDLLSDVISSMKSQGSFLAPVISGIVIGIGSMITNVLGKIGPALEGQEMDSGAAGMDMTDFFGVGIPTFYFQIIVGIYVIELIYILTVLVNGVENGSDKLKEQYLVGNNLLRGTVLYCGLALAVIIAFNYIADVVITQTLTGV